MSGSAHINSSTTHTVSHLCRATLVPKHAAREPPGTSLCKGPVVAAPRLDASLSAGLPSTPGDTGRLRGRHSFPAQRFIREGRAGTQLTRLTLRTYQTITPFDLRRSRLSLRRLPYFCEGHLPLPGEGTPRSASGPSPGFHLSPS